MRRWEDLFAEVRLGDGDAIADAVAGELFTWGIHRRAGFRVSGDHPTDVGGRAILRVGPGPLAITAPVEVIDVHDGASGRGFTYRALPGHPEEGDETFLVERRPSGVWFSVSAHSRPGTWWSRLGAPVTRAAQRYFTARYLRGAEEIARSVESAA